MALSNETKHKIVRYLGFSAKSIIPGSTHFKSQLADALEDLDDVSEASLESLVCRIEALDLRLEGALDRLSAIKIDDIHLRDDEIQKLRNERHRLVKEIGRLIDIHPQSGGMTIGVCV